MIYSTRTKRNEETEGEENKKGETHQRDNGKNVTVSTDSDCPLRSKIFNPNQEAHEPTVHHTGGAAHEPGTSQSL